MVSRGRIVMFGFVIEAISVKVKVISVKVKREERNREWTKLFEIKRT